MTFGPTLRAGNDEDYAWPSRPRVRVMFCLAVVRPSPYPLPAGEGSEGVQTGNIVYRMNRAHGLQCGGNGDNAIIAQRLRITNKFGVINFNDKD